MNRASKLTVAVPTDSLKKARAYAKRQGTSLSTLVSKLLQSVESYPKDASSRKTDGLSVKITHASVGMISLPPLRKADLLTDALQDRYRQS